MGRWVFPIRHVAGADVQRVLANEIRVGETAFDSRVGSFVVERVAIVVDRREENSRVDS